MVCRKPRVIIIDDEQVVCDVLHGELSERGYLCTTVLSGNDALAKLATQDFDVALVDIKLPGISGIEVLRKMRSNHQNIVAIMITGVNDVGTAVETMKLGASDYIVKPFDLDRVNTSIRTALKSKPATKKSSTEMDAIARGVEAELDSLTDHSTKVILKTVDIARQLGIPEREIQKWAAARAGLATEKNRAITSLLKKFRRSPLAQCVMGVTELHQPTSNLNESRN